ncbi:hypothetical protein OESDEN_25332 [Oesophagostomum dentatum]|uniref:Uncharacterized protein n=1 Tax=Oesophagostomum dentatum TaxID=61180 RepID=A0A0B1RV82_OESDE|nr:hypothetical protein OESDEN_25332 [Oesophagostomum dentatum]
MAWTLNESLAKINNIELGNSNGLNITYNNETDLQTFVNVIRDDATKMGCSKYTTCRYGGNKSGCFTMCITDQPWVLNFMDFSVLASISQM